MTFKHGSLFSGIGGFDLPAQWMGWENVFHCEWNPFGQRVLKYYWPDAELFTDITKSNFKKYHGSIDIISGGFPCQPYSEAGKRLGKEDERHLWPEMLRAVREIQPSYVVGENVRGLTNWNGGVVFDEVQADMESEGYEVLPFLLPACAVNAPHRRDRIWFIAYSSSYGCQRRKQRMQETPKQGYDEKSLPSGRVRRSEWGDSLPRPRIFRNDDGLSERLAAITISSWRNESIKAYGNAVVPQIPFEIFKAIEAYENIP